MTKALHEMSDKELYDLYDHIDCLKDLNSKVSKIIYRDLMAEHKLSVIDALQTTIIEIMHERM